VADGIADERRMIGRLRDTADVVIDTSTLTPHQFKQLLLGHFRLGSQALMRIAVMSFSYRRGLPREADLVFDVRFLKNPHYVPELKPMTGRDAKVVAFIEADPDYGPFIERLQGNDRAAAAAIRRRGQELSNYCGGLHRWPPPLGGGGRKAGGMVARRRALGHSLAP
jgi:RNase adaptor protein for sRNA GlmZ degradation